MTEHQKGQIELAQWLLRIGLAFAYFYVVLEEQTNPGDLLKYIPAPVQHMLPIHIFFVVFGIFEVLLALWFLSGKHTEYAGIISFILMVAIVIPNTIFFSVLFRDVTIAFASLALSALDYGMNYGNG